MDHMNGWADVLDPSIDPIDARAYIRATIARDQQVHDPRLFSDQASSHVPEARAQDAWPPRRMALVSDTSYISPHRITRETASTGQGTTSSSLYASPADSQEQMVRSFMVTGWPSDPSELAGRFGVENPWLNTEEDSYDDGLEAIRHSEEEQEALLRESIDTLPLYDEAAINDRPPSYQRLTNKKPFKRSSKAAATSKGLAQKAKRAHQYLRQQVCNIRRPQSTAKRARTNTERRGFLGRRKMHEPLLPDPR